MQELLQLGNNAVEFEVVHEGVAHSLPIDSIKLQEEQYCSVVVKLIGLYKPDCVYLLERSLLRLAIHLVPDHSLVRLL